MIEWELAASSLEWERPQKVWETKSLEKVRNSLQQREIELDGQSDT